MFSDLTRCCMELRVMTTPTHAVRLICDEELGTAVRSGAVRRQATDVSRSLCFEQFFPTPPATRTSYEIYNECSAAPAYVHFRRTIALCLSFSDVWMLYFVDGQNELMF